MKILDFIESHPNLVSNYNLQNTIIESLKEWIRSPSDKRESLNLVQTLDSIQGVSNRISIVNVNLPQLPSIGNKERDVEPLFVLSISYEDTKEFISLTKEEETILTQVSKDFLFKLFYPKFSDSFHYLDKLNDLSSFRKMKIKNQKDNIQILLNFNASESPLEEFISKNIRLEDKQNLEKIKNFIFFWLLSYQYHMTFYDDLFENPFEFWTIFNNHEKYGINFDLYSKGDNYIVKTLINLGLNRNIQNTPVYWILQGETPHREELLFSPIATAVPRTTILGQPESFTTRQETLDETLDESFISRQPDMEALEIGVRRMLSRPTNLQNPEFSKLIINERAMLLEINNAIELLRKFVIARSQYEMGSIMKGIVILRENKQEIEEKLTKIYKRVQLITPITLNIKNQYSQMLKLYFDTFSIYREDASYQKIHRGLKSNQKFKWKIPENFYYNSY